MASSIEVCLIDTGLESLKNLELSSGIINLNLHCNKIHSIEHLTNLSSLKHLDLSSNDIRKISGLSACHNLQTLNLACNVIVKVEGIDLLKQLQKLNLSYNQINDISGFKAISKRTHILSHVELHGNRLTSLKHITQNLFHCNCVKHLYLKKDNDGNPVCEISAYRPNMLSQLPWLESLDGKDMYGNSIRNVPVDIHNIPGLDEYLALLEPSSTNTSVVNVSPDESQSDLVTPRIDNALKRFGKKTDESNVEQQNSRESHTVTSQANNVTSRLDSLEGKLTSLVKLCTENQIAGTRDKNEVFVCIDATSSSETLVSSDDITIPITNQPKQQEKQKQEKQIQKKLKPAMKKTQPKRTALCDGKGKENIQQGKLNKTTENTVETDKELRGVRSTKDDETFLSLMNEMDSERERRWKAEQASRKLLESIKILQEKVIEERKIQEVAISSSTKLERELKIQQEARVKFEEFAGKLGNENNSLKDELDKLRESDESSKRTISSLEATIQKIEKEKFEEGHFQEKRYKELQLDTGGYSRELELMKNTVEKQKCQLLQLQELLVSREQEHKNALLGMVSIDSKEVRDMTDREIIKYETKNSEITRQNLEKLKQSKSEYIALEDEFRMALQIEANRYNGLYTSHEHTNEEFNQLKISFEELSQKEAKSRGLLTELTALVKEQKARITEINKCKCDMQVQFKERVDQLENEVKNLRKKSAQCDSLQQDKDRMAAHIRGQESIILGLRSERKLWGQELAQQGASLAHEKGRIDIQLESLQNEINSLQKQLNNSNDSLKIKCKLIEDQTDTIKVMKEESIKLTEEKRRLLDGLKEERDNLNDELEHAREQIEELHETVNSLTDRKAELKSQLASLDEELKNSQDELKNLRGQWEERSKLIDQFEEKVIKMKNSFDEKEKNLIKEKHMKSEQLNIAEEKLKEYEGKYRSELAAMKHDFNLELRKIISKKDDEIQKAKEEVSRVEEEMRTVLHETNKQKKTLEARLINLSKAFSDIQKDLT